MFSFLAKPTKPTAEKLWNGLISTGADCLGKRKDISGRSLRFASGEVITEDNAGGLLVKDRLGRICKTVSRTGAETTFGYSDDNALNTIRMHSGVVYERLNNNRWQKRGESSLSAPDLEFHLKSDGTLRACRISERGQRCIQDYYLDGSSRMFNDKGREVCLKTNLAVQQQRLFAVLDNLQRQRLIGAEQRQAICDALHSLQRRIRLDEITDVEAGKTVFHVTRLLESGGDSPLGAQQCFLLANELLFFSACPDFADTSDALSRLIAELFRLQPSQAAMLVTEMSMRKRYITSSGWTIQYAEELMNPIVRRNSEWSCANEERRFVESNRFLRVVLINIVERLRLAERASNISLLEKRKRLFSTREFGRVFDKDLAKLWQQLTGQECALDLTALRKNGDVQAEPDNIRRLSLSGSQLPRALA